MAKQSQSQRAWYERNKKKQMQASSEKRKAIKLEIASYKEKHGCSRCPEDNPVCLQFHHTEKEAKDFTVAAALRKGLSQTKIWAEIRKCEVLCANCHLKEHHADEVFVVTQLPSKQQ